MSCRDGQDKRLNQQTKSLKNLFSMKKIMFAILCMSVLYACTEAGEGSEVSKDTTATQKDTMTQVGTGGSATSNDTSSYDRLPTTTTGDSTNH